MTMNDMIKIMAIIEAAYPRFYANKTDADKMAALNLWYRHFEKLDYSVMLQAVDAVIASNKFPPTIADINEKLNLMRPNDLEEMSELEAWSYVSRAIKNSLYNCGEEFAKLPPAIQKIVGCPQQLHEWSMMDEEKVQTVIASNVQRSFRVIKEHERQLLSLPAECRTKELNHSSV